MKKQGRVILRELHLLPVDVGEIICYKREGLGPFGTAFDNLCSPSPCVSEKAPCRLRFSLLSSRSHQRALDCSKTVRTASQTKLLLECTSCSLVFAGRTAVKKVHRNTCVEFVAYSDGQVLEHRRFRPH